MADGEFMFCSAKGCTNKIKNHAWGRIKAEGWVEQKNGKLWCPDHIPDWYAGWTRRKTK